MVMGKICIITNVTNCIIKYNYCYSYNYAKIITYEQNANFEVCVIQGLCEFMKSFKQLTLKDVKLAACPTEPCHTPEGVWRQDSRTSERPGPQTINGMLVISIAHMGKLSL